MWTLFNLDPNTSINTITLDGDGSTPTITVNPLGEVDPGVNDFLIQDVLLSGTQGFRKLGDGILTIGGNSNSVTGTVTVEAGTLRLAGSADTSTNADIGSAITLKDGTTLEDLRSAWVTLQDITIADPNGVVTITLNGGQNKTLKNVQGPGSGTLNINIKSTKAAYIRDGWASGGFDVMNLAKTGGTDNATFRMRPIPDSGDAALNLNLFEGTQLNLTGMELSWENIWSTGGTIPIGSLNGDAASILYGTGAGIRYQIGGNDDPNANFAGTVSTGNMSIEKVGTGKQTFSGSFVSGFGGKAIRVSEGTLAFAGSVTSLPGGTALEPTVVNVLSGANLDLTGVDSSFSLSADVRIQGTGTVTTGTDPNSGWDHAAGSIAPGDVDSNGNPSNDYIATAGTLVVDGDLSFSGGTIDYDMWNVPNDPNNPNDLISVTGETSVAGGGVVSPNFLNGDPNAGLTYTVLTSAGGFSDSLSGWSVDWQGRGAAPTVFIAGNDLQFTTTALNAVGDILWTGVSAGDPNTAAPWRIQDPNNNDWTLSGSPDDFFNGDNVTFPEAGVTTYKVDIVENVTPGSVVVDSATDYTFTASGGQIQGAGALTKRGTSTLTLQFDNTYSGGTTIENGTIDIGSAVNALGTGTLTLGDGTNGGTLVTAINADDIGVSDIVVDGNGNNTIVVGGSGGPGSYLEINSISSADPNADASLTITNPDVDNKWVYLEGFDDDFKGSLTISGPNDPNSAPNAGMLVRLDAWTVDFSGVTLTLNKGVTTSNLRGTSVLETIEIGALAGDATSTLKAFDGGASPPSTNYAVGHLNSTSTFNGTVNASGNGGMSLEKVGTGIQTFTGPFINFNNAGAGAIRVSEGTLDLAFADPNTPFIQQDPNGSEISINVMSGATLDVSNSANTFQLQDNQKLIGSGTIVSGTGLDLAGGSLRPGDTDPGTSWGTPSNTSQTAVGTITVTGDLEVSGGTLVYDYGADPNTSDLVDASGTVTLTSGSVTGVAIDGLPTAGQTYTVMTAASFSGAATNLTLDLPGRAPDPSLFITGGTQLQFTTPTAVSHDLTWTGSADPNAGWDIETTANWYNNTTASADTYYEGDNVTFDVTGAANPVVTINGSVNPNSVTVDSPTPYIFDGGTIDGGASLTKSGTGKLSLETNNSYTGGTTINAGIVDIRDAGSVGSGTVTLNGSGEFHVGASSGNNLDNDFVINGGSTVIANNASGSQSLRLFGNLSGSGSVSFENGDPNDTNGIDLEGDNSSFTGSATLGGGTSATFLRLRGDENAAGTGVAWDLGNNGSTLAVVNIEPTATISLGSLAGGASSTLTGHASSGGDSQVTFEIGGNDSTTTFSGLITDGSGDSDPNTVLSLTSIVKEGTGILTLDGMDPNNSYSGDTSVLAGTLSITEDYLADTADVYMLTGAVLNLDFGSTIIDTIDSLFFNGVSQATGTWGGVGSGATYESAFITGDGWLLVSTSAGLAGDFNSDGRVDGLDFLLWQRNPAVGNLADWEASYGSASTSTTTTTVPEPSSVMLLTAALAGLSLVRKRNV